MKRKPGAAKYRIAIDDHFSFVVHEARPNWLKRKILLWVFGWKVESK